MGGYVNVTLLYLGVFPTAIAYACWFEAGTKLKPTLLAIIFNLSVVFTIINSYIFLDEKLSLFSWIGMGIILSAIAFMVMNKKEQKLIDISVCKQN